MDGLLPININSINVVTENKKGNFLISLLDIFNLIIWSTTNRNTKLIWL